MAKTNHAPGVVRDAILAHFGACDGEARVSEICSSVESVLGSVPKSSVRSYLSLNPDIFTRVERGFYRLNKGLHLQRFSSAGDASSKTLFNKASVSFCKSNLYQGDCFEWLNQRSSNSIHAVVTA